MSRRGLLLWGRRLLWGLLGLVAMTAAGYGLVMAGALVYWWWEPMSSAEKRWFGLACLVVLAWLTGGPLLELAEDWRWRIHERRLARRTRQRPEAPPTFED